MFVVEIWGFLVLVVVFLQFFYTLILGRRNPAIKGFAGRYATYLYTYYRYLFFATNKRPWPFEEMPEEAGEHQQLGQT